MSDQTIKLPCFGIVVTLTAGPKQTWSPKRPLMLSGTISSDLHEDCDGRALAAFSDCACANCNFNRTMDGIEALILAHACARIDITTPAYVTGIETAVQAAADNT